jgi:uncharacterized protein (TIGR00251 family)
VTHGGPERLVSRLTVRVRPSAKRSSVIDHDGQTVRVDVAAPAVEGRANDELIHTLARELGVSKSRIRIVRGQNARTKLLEVDIGPRSVDEWLSAVSVRSTEAH